MPWRIVHGTQLGMVFFNRWDVETLTKEKTKLIQIGETANKHSVTNGRDKKTKTI